MEKEPSSFSHPKLLKLFEIINTLRAGRYTIRQLMEKFDAAKSTMYRYMDLLTEAGFCIEKDFHDRFFIATTEEDPLLAQFTVEEIAMMRTLMQADPSNPLNSSILKKLKLKSEMDALPRMFLKAHLANLVEQLTTAMRNKHQVILHKYISPNSKAVGDRLIEPIHFGDNYKTIIALDTQDLKCKQFKLDRMSEITETHKYFVHEALHRKGTTDIFGMDGEPAIWITLNLQLRAYLLLREEHPMALPYLTDLNNRYTFHGPVANFAGIGRFVMGLIDQVEIVEPAAFREYIEEKLRNLKNVPEG